jgi:50S ribosomal protein L16 3-hydroxylase
MDSKTPLALLGALSPAQFMRRYWQKKPLLVRAALPGFQALLSRSELFALASRDDVESRLVMQSRLQGAAATQARRQGWPVDRWKLRQGPFSRRSLPPLNQSDWTLLVQGVDMHSQAAHELLTRFRFVPDVRLDDLMISYASPGGGVGPHFDSYDVFLLQAHGRRRWRIGPQRDLTLRDDVPLKVLANFEPEQEWVLEPGDMLYLPPRYAHDGVAESECMTYSIGFRAPRQQELARELLMRMADQADECLSDTLYRDPKQSAVTEPAAMTQGLQQFAQRAVQAVVNDPHALSLALGEYLSEPKPNVWFERSGRPVWPQAVRLDPRTRMVYDVQHLFVNGESLRATGPDARVMRQLANARQLSLRAVQKASPAVQTLLQSWLQAGWVHGVPDGPRAVTQDLQEKIEQ